MKTIIIASLFCMDNFLPILLGLLGAALLGWLLKGFLGGGGSSAGADWEAKYKASIADLNSEKEKNNKLSADLKNKKSKTDNSSKAMGVAAVAEGGASASEVESMQNKMRALKEEVKTITEAKNKIEAEVNAANMRAKEATTLNSELETAKVRIEGLARALDTSKAEAEKYKSDFDNANGERTRLNNQLNNSDAGALQKRIDKLENDLDSARISNSNLQAQMDRLKSGPKTISQVVAPKAEKVVVDSSSKERVKELEMELLGLKSHQERLDKQTELNKLAIQAAVNEANAKNNAEVIELRSRLKFAEASITKLEEDKTKLAMAVGATSIKLKEVEPIVVAPKPAPVVEAPKPEPVDEAPKPEPMAEAPKPAPTAEAEVEEPTVVAEEPIVVAEPVAEVHKDDLTVVEGIGPKIGELIHAANIHTYAQLADTPVDTLQSILNDAGDRYAMHKPGTWPEQAALLRDGKMDEFKALCAELDGGVRVEKSAANTETEEELEAAIANPDDLKVLEGVGPVLAKILNDGGIYTYKQLAAKQASHLKALLEASGDMMHDPAAWPQQAELLRDGKMDEFKALCDTLKAGRE
jgi:predicted flap endonuclease-1-like 5' DNA nuclease